MDTLKEQQLYYEQKLQYELDAWDLKEAMSKGEKVIAVDARSAETFKNEHIPGAINIPHRTMTAESTAHLDKSILYVTYCDGIGCNASTKGALNLVKLGFQVKELMGGIDWWKRDGYATEGTIANQSKVIACGC
jgi:rhodanese-related sulfurtransferase